MIIVTRPSPYGEELVQLCHQANLAAIHLPFFNITKGDDLDQLQQQLNLLKKDDIVIIVSPQVILMLKHYNMVTQFPDFVRYFAVGKQTAQQFQIFTNHIVDYPKTDENSEGLIRYFQSIKLPLKQHNVLILSGDISRSVIHNELKSQGALVKNIYCYRRNTTVYPSTILEHSQSDFFVITSIEHLRQLEQYCNSEHKQHARLIVSSERILNEAKKSGWQYIYLASNANNQNLFKTIVSLCHNAAIT
ncbi:uroporphyrinogen-III synthase [Orbus mooreae]|uniref:uroporphyrinogen-III synthase n=1 Tax=Orbus mooreae TaxID=3074107 RepID=UPI00370D12C5